MYDSAVSLYIFLQAVQITDIIKKILYFYSNIAGFIKNLPVFIKAGVKATDIIRRFRGKFFPAHFLAQKGKERLEAGGLVTSSGCQPLFSPNPLGREIKYAAAGSDRLYD